MLSKLKTSLPYTLVKFDEQILSQKRHKSTIARDVNFQFNKVNRTPSDNHIISKTRRVHLNEKSSAQCVHFSIKVKQ